MTLSNNKFIAMNIKNTSISSESFFAVIISFISILISIFNINSPLKMEIDRIFSIIGLTTTVIAFLIGAYFALLAVSAYSHVKNIYIVENNMEDLERKVYKKKEDLNLLSESVADLIYEFYSQQIDSAHKSSNKTRYENIKNFYYRKRSLLAIKFSCLNNNKRITAITEFSATANKDDLPILQNLINNDKEDKDAIAAAKVVINYINRTFS